MKLTLEELNYFFVVPTAKLMKYQVAVAMSYFLRRRVFLQHDDVLRPS